MRTTTALAAVSVLALGAVVPAVAGAQDEPATSLSPLDAPRRVLDTRDGASTADGEFVGGGPTEPDTTIELPIAGRVGVPETAGAVALNLTAVNAEQEGFVTAFPCGEDRPNASNLNVGDGGTIAGGAFVRVGDAGQICLYTSAVTHLVVDVAGHFPDDGVDALDAPQRLLDTREASATADGQFERIGQREAGSTLELDVAGRAGLPDPTPPVVLTVTVDALDDPGYVTVFPCDDQRPTASSLNHAAGQTIANTSVSRVDDQGRICLYTSADTHLIVDAAATLPPSTYATLEQPRRLLDTRASDSTVDGEFSGNGLRPQRSTLELDVAGRAGIPDHAGAVLLNVTAVEARTAGFATVHPAGVDRPTASNLNVAEGDTVANSVVTRLGSGGAVCLHADASAHYVVDVVGWFPGTPAATSDEACPSPPLFPTYRMVALYGTDASDQLGALGEQTPEEAADRLREVMQPWEQASDRPVLGTFELIATIATAAPGDDGLYRSVSPSDRVQRYLDVARQHGFYLVLDIQPGRSDFLTEVQRYEEFLREPDVGVALDPEWRMGPDEVPGQLVGQVSAAEVNDVARYLADIVADEGLPQKLLIVHQFQDRMITDRDQLIAPPELAVNIHMDGFGTREMKLETYSVTRIDPPFSNGFKLFYDEDIDIFGAADVLEFDPVPDFVSYQ
ncbi:MAG: hypothetical protein EA389_03600 [Ilumatobacter sp.]|nr:MAG: hypothetical protein EA389_03600 [Ilumatobacter sp.]